MTLLSMRLWEKAMMQHLMTQATLQPSPQGSQSAQVMLDMQDLHAYTHAIQHAWILSLGVSLTVFIAIVGWALSGFKQRQRQFANQISHELRTPLSTVYGYLQSLLRRAHNLTPAQREALEIATAETQYTVELLQHLLEHIRRQSSQSSQSSDAIVR